MLESMDVIKAEGEAINRGDLNGATEELDEARWQLKRTVRL